MNWIIKRFNELSIAELYQILKLRNEIFIVEQQCAYQDCDGKDESSYHLYLSQNGSVIAYLRIIDKGVSYKETAIGRVVVQKSHRGKGLARDMMLAAINFIKADLKENEIRLQAQSYLVGFYGSFGFRAVSDEYLEDGIPHVDMLYGSKELTNC